MKIIKDPKQILIGILIGVIGTVGGQIIFSVIENPIENILQPKTPLLEITSINVTNIPSLPDEKFTLPNLLCQRQR